MSKIMDLFLGILLGTLYQDNFRLILMTLMCIMTTYVILKKYYNES